METKSKRDPKNKPTNKTDSNGEKGIERSRPRCLKIAQKGVRTGSDFAEMMSALMSDIIEENITPQSANAVVNAGGKLLKVTEMQLKYGKVEEQDTKTLKLV